MDGLPVKNSKMVDNIGASPIMNHVAGFEPSIFINDQMYLTIGPIIRIAVSISNPIRTSNAGIFNHSSFFCFTSVKDSSEYIFRSDSENMYPSDSSRTATQ